jgi:hypothetical protein
MEFRENLTLQQFVMIALSGLMFSAASENVVAQAGGVIQRQEAEIRLTTLYPPDFPAMANAARVGGDVELKVGIRLDGTVESATAVGGTEHLPANGAFANWGLPQFTQAALESATQSRFECRGCVLSVTFYSLAFSFEPGPLLRGNCPSVEPMNPLWRRTNQPEVTQAGNHVAVIGPLLPVCPGPQDYYQQVRSAKCLYLWKCSAVPAFHATHR